MFRAAQSSSLFPFLNSERVKTMCCPLCYIPAAAATSSLASYGLSTQEEVICGVPFLSGLIVSKIAFPKRNASSRGKLASFVGAYLVLGSAARYLAYRMAGGAGTATVPAQEVAEGKTKNVIDRSKIVDTPAGPGLPTARTGLDGVQVAADGCTKSVDVVQSTCQNQNLSKL
ncbi:unnamed protein product [Amoebophrya sp. A120]|nr:unnamed protein product [Amoebophrya sp. A120]|eukprot:GSA120T00023712001.1